MMEAAHLKLNELVHFADGLVDMHGRRLIIHDFHALGQLQRDLMKMVGPDQAKRILTRFGYFWGQADASTMQRIFQWETKTEMIKAGFVLNSLQGAGLTETKIVHIDETAEQYWIECTWQHSGTAEAYLAELGKAEQPVCWFLIGYASGYTSFCTGKSVYFVEDQCFAVGDPYCHAIGKDIDSWGDEIKPYLDYFHADDIHGKIVKLSTQIRQMEEQLDLQKKLLERALSGSSLASVEIQSIQFQQIMNLANKVAKFDSSVLITGETGVGKDMLARHIHQFSPRAKGPFVAVNCAALTDTLLESELFGHKAGAFTGATRDKRGLFEEAQNGVIFLDEIGDISQAMQSKLLRVLQEREILRVGDTRPIKVDFRLISATNKILENEVAKGTFREDLYYRLQVIHIPLPPLRERREDILPLARHFVQKSAQRLSLSSLVLDTTCIDYLLAFQWPGNIRELENAIEHAAILSTDGIIKPEHLPHRIIQSLGVKSTEAATRLALEDVEMEHIKRVLALVDGNREEAARILQIGVATLYRKLAKIKQSPDEQ
jgi:two-component system, NtrC family, response regulator HydG